MHVDPRLLELLRAHRDRYTCTTAPDCDSDHGPMACLALAGLGAPSNASHATRPLPAEADPVERTLRRSMRDSYARRSATSRRIPAFARLFRSRDRRARCGRDAAPSPARARFRLGTDAYHATIRLGYGIEFDVASEIAAGLAYLAALGPDALGSRRLGDATRGEDDPLAAARDVFRPSSARARSRSATTAVMTSGAIAALYASSQRMRCGARAERRSTCSIPRTRFFALHLVTGSHAMRVCLPFGGPSGRTIAVGRCRSRDISASAHRATDVA